mmetsp:Transcript_102095/g.295403  ORF Transcript_102095/g.295403 Transcript_102095/m.295403 type:complete len:178 (+) Transcript_102095:186-719(+)
MEHSINDLCGGKISTIVGVDPIDGHLGSEALPTDHSVNRLPHNLAARVLVTDSSSLLWSEKTSCLPSTNTNSILLPQDMQTAGGWHQSCIWINPFIWSKWATTSISCTIGTQQSTTSTITIVSTTIGTIVSTTTTNETTSRNDSKATDVASQVLHASLGLLVVVLDHISEFLMGSTE